MVSAIITADEKWGVCRKGGRIPFACEEIWEHQVALRNRNPLIFGHHAAMDGDVRFRIDDRSDVFVLTHEPEVFLEKEADYEVPCTWNDLKKLLLNNKKTKTNFCIIGGITAFDWTMKYTQQIFLTKVYQKYPDTIAWMPNLDRDSNWLLTDVSKMMLANNTQFRFCTYTRIGGR